MRRMKALATALGGIVALLIVTALAATPLAFAEEAKTKPGEAGKISSFEFQWALWFETIKPGRC